MGLWNENERDMQQLSCSTKIEFKYECGGEMETISTILSQQIKMKIS
jgi:hypothetical protein